MVVLIPDIKILNSEPVDICGGEVTDAAMLKENIAVETEVQYLMERFVTAETKTQNRTGATISVHYDDYYIMPVFVEDDVYYIAYKLSDEADNAMDIIKLVDEYATPGTLSPDTAMDDPVPVKGGLYELGDEEYEYMLAWFDAEDWHFEGSAEQYVLPVVFEPFVEGNVAMMVKVSIGAAVLGLVLLILGFVIGRDKAKRAKELKKLADKTITINGISYDVLKIVQVTDVDKWIQKGKPDKAKKELMKVFKASETEADAIIADWERITTP